MNTIVFSLCSGTQSRFELDVPKQLCDINGTPLLLRTAQQVHDRGHLLYVTAHKPEIIKASSYDHRITLLEGSPSIKIVNTMAELATLWEERTIFLLGDVYYTDDALDKIFDYAGGIQFFGTTYELFALSVESRRQGALLTELVDAKRDSRGKLWHLLRRVIGVDWEYHNTLELKESPFLTLIEDETDDIDTVDQWKKLLEKIKEESD